MAQLNDLLVLGKGNIKGALTAKNDNDFISHSNEYNYIPSGYSGELYINYRTSGGSNGAIANYRFCSGSGAALAGVCASTFYGNLSGNATSATTATSAASATSASYLTSRGNVTAESGTTRPAVSGLSMSQVYNNSYPTTYGNVITLNGGGCGELLIGWPGTNGAIAPMYVRSKRDTSDANWSDWCSIPFENKNNSFTGVNMFAAGTTYNTTATQYFKIGNANSMWVLGADGMQCFKGTSNPTAAKEAFLQYYGGGLQNGSPSAQSYFFQYGDMYVRKDNGGSGGNLTIASLLTQGSTDSDSSIASMNRFENDVYVAGNGSAPNTPKVAGFYLGKSKTDNNRHLDIVSGETFSYIDFNQASSANDYTARLIVNVTNGFTEFSWDSAATSKYLKIHGTMESTKGAVISGRVNESGDDEGLIIKPANNGYAGVCLGSPSARRSVFYLSSSGPFWRYNAGPDGNGNATASYDIYHPSKSGTMAITSDLNSYLPLSGGTMTGPIIFSNANGNNKNKNYLSAGGGYSTGSGRLGLKLVACDQNDVQTGIGMDLTGLSYETCLSTSRLNDSTTSYITFATHNTESTTYHRLGYFQASGAASPAATFVVHGVIECNKMRTQNHGTATQMNAITNAAEGEIFFVYV